jgi:AraC-like DNA-binding protein
MLLSHEIWSVFLFSGAVQGLLLAGTLFFNPRGRRLANALLATMLLSSVLILLSPMLMALKEFRATALTWELGFFLTASIGPLFYFYTRALLYPEYKPRILYVFLTAVLPGLVRVSHWHYVGMDFNETLAMVSGAIARVDEGIDLHLCYICVTWATIQRLYSLPFIYLAWRHVTRTESRLMDEYSGGVSRHIKWLKLITAVLVIVALHGVVSWSYLMVTRKFTIEWTYVYPLMLCLFIQCVAIAAFFLPEGFVSAVGDLPVRNRRTSVDMGAANRYLSALQDFMDKRKPYRVEGLRLADLAEMVSIPARELSELINDRFQMNYFDFINGYRVEDAKAMMRDSANDQFTLLAVARDAGFRSKSSFNRVFRKHAGTSPSEYRASIRSSRDSASSMKLYEGSSR